ncbi:MAG: hypothetical protein RRY21_07600, partial [Oscillospiraceae bacterium]
AKTGDKLGLASANNLAKSKDATAEKAGVAQSYVTYAAVTFDGKGKISSCMLDAVQVNVGFDASGKVTSDLTAVTKTKNELGASYGMKGASGIGKEWNEQANALCAYVIGKTIDQVKGIAVNEKGAPTEKELSASVTVGIGGYVAAIEKAVANAQSLGAKTGDKLGLASANNIAKSKDATAEKAGVAQSYVT